jgi:hypothetical protein
MQKMPIYSDLKNLGDYDLKLGRHATMVVVIVVVVVVVLMQQTLLI